VTTVGLVSNTQDLEAIKRRSIGNLPKSREGWPNAMDRFLLLTLLDLYMTQFWSASQPKLQIRYPTPPTKNEPLSESSIIVLSSSSHSCICFRSWTDQVSMNELTILNTNPLKHQPRHRKRQNRRPIRRSPSELLSI